MAATFILTCLVGAIIVIAPGALVLRALRLPLQRCLTMGAPLSIALVGIGGVLCRRFALAGPAWFAAVIVLLAACLSALLFFALRGPRRERPAQGAASWLTIALYLAVNIAIMGYLFLLCLDSLDAIIPIGDSNYHIAVVKSMMESGDFSTLSVTPYPDTLPAAEVPLYLAGYYPAAWHAVTALTALLAGSSAALAENAVNFLFAAVIFPLGVLALLRIAFPQERTVALCGALVACACVAFPLRPLLVHQIYPNIAGFSCLPAVVALACEALRAGADGRHRISYGIAAFLGLIGLGLLHPGVFLASGVFLFAIVACIGVPQAARFIAAAREGGAMSSAKAWRVILTVLWCALFLAAWLFLLNLPALSSVTDYLWDWTVPLPQALSDLAWLGLRLEEPQHLLALLALAGTVRCLRRPQQRWVVLAAALFGLIFVADAIGTPAAKRFFAGFWYTDPERTSALVAIAIVPLTASGLAAVFDFLKRAASKLEGIGGGRATGKSAATAVYAVSAAIVVIVFVCGNFLIGKIALPFSGTGEQSGFAITRGALYDQSDPANSPLYTAAEAAFVDEALDLIERETGDGDALIVNMPHDGSLFAFPLNDANVYYKSYLRGAPETPASDAVRHALDEAATSEEVREALREIGAEYVLVLNHDDGENYDSNRWKEEDWTGFDDLTDATPGFEALLAEGDMRLYRITALD